MVIQDMGLHPVDQEATHQDLIQAIHATAPQVLHLASMDSQVMDHIRPSHGLAKMAKVALRVIHLWQILGWEALQEGPHTCPVRDHMEHHPRLVIMDHNTMDLV